MNMKLTTSAPSNFARSDQLEARGLAEAFLRDAKKAWYPPTDENLSFIDSSVHPGLYPLVRFYIHGAKL